MPMRIPVLLLLLSISTPVLAALPPQYQRQAELRAIIDSAEVVDAFGFDGITAIEYVEPDLYRVRGGSCALDVRIVDLPDTHGPGWVGPRAFGIEVGAAICE
jgi:hypothetical protein